MNFLDEIYLTLLLVGHAIVPDGSSEVDQYIRTMAKLKPQWSDAKIRAAAQHHFVNVPGTIPMGARYTAPRFMSRAEIKSALYAIASEHPGWRAYTFVENLDCGIRMSRANRVETRFKSCFIIDHLNKLVTQKRLMSSVVDKRSRSELAVMKQAIATASPDADRRVILKAASESFRKQVGVRRWNLCRGIRCICNRLARTIGVGRLPVVIN